MMTVVFGAPIDGPVDFFASSSVIYGQAAVEKSMVKNKRRNMLAVWHISRFSAVL